MKNLILTIIPLMFISCTTYKKDDHSYTYFHQNNVYQSKEEEHPPTQTFNKNNSDKFFYKTQERDMLDTSVDLSRHDPDLYYYQNDADETFLSRNQPFYRGNGVTYSPHVRKYLRYGETRR